VIIELFSQFILDDLQCAWCLLLCILIKSGEYDMDSVFHIHGHCKLLARVNKILNESCIRRSANYTPLLFHGKSKNEICHGKVVWQTDSMSEVQYIKT